MALFKQGKDERRGAGGPREGAGRKPKEIRQLEADWKTDAKSASDVMNELYRLSLGADDETVRVAACKAFMDRIVGKPKQQVDVNLKSSDMTSHYQRAKSALETGELMDVMRGAKTAKAATTKTPTGTPTGNKKPR